jgi:hypothetical protein
VSTCVTWTHRFSTTTLGTFLPTPVARVSRHVTMIVISPAHGFYPGVHTGPTATPTAMDVRVEWSSQVKAAQRIGQIFDHEPCEARAVRQPPQAHAAEERQLAQLEQIGEALRQLDEGRAARAIQRFQTREGANALGQCCKPSAALHPGNAGKTGLWAGGRMSFRRYRAPSPPPRTSDLRTESRPPPT